MLSSMLQRQTPTVAEVLADDDARLWMTNARERGQLTLSVLDSNAAETKIT